MAFARLWPGLVAVALFASTAITGPARAVQLTDAQVNARAEGMKQALVRYKERGFRLQRVSGHYSGKLAGQPVDVDVFGPYRILLRSKDEEEQYCLIAGKDLQPFQWADGSGGPFPRLAGAETVGIDRDGTRMVVILIQGSGAFPFAFELRREGSTWRETSFRSLLAPYRH